MGTKPGIRRMKGLLGATVLWATLAHPLLAQQRQAATPPRPKSSASDEFQVLITYAGLAVADQSDGLAPQQRWEKRLTDEGLKRGPDSASFWTLNDSTGEVRVSAFFQPEATFFLSFFPADKTPIPDALLSSLSAKAEAMFFTEGGDLELVFPERRNAEDGFTCSGTVQDSVRLRMTGGVLVSQTKILKCKKK
jgi:hypothetical protein